MEIAKLRKIINEEVRKAIQSELRDILVEAVEIASTPSDKIVKEVRVPSVERDYGLSSMLQDTAESMTKEDYLDLLSDTDGVVQVPEKSVQRKVGSMKGLAAGTNPDTMKLPDELPDFVTRAQQVFESSKGKSTGNLEEQNVVRFNPEENLSDFSEDLLLD